MIRWRSHAHVLRQPVGWFESDFAGRIANRIMQTPPAAADAVFQIFDAMAFASVTVVGAGIMLADADPRLLLPLIVWFVLYMALVRWTVNRAGPAAQAASDARSMVTGRVVDAYTNIHSVKLFAHQAEELGLCQGGDREGPLHPDDRNADHHGNGPGLNLLNAALIVSVTGWALYLWGVGAASIGTVAAASRWCCG
jgi:ATP-binding cassette subfamily B multidrug efflux pump